MSATLSSNLKHVIHFLSQKDLWNAAKVVRLRVNVRRQRLPQLSSIARQAARNNHNSTAQIARTLIISLEVGL